MVKNVSFLIVITLMLLGCAKAPSTKIKGVSFVASRDSVQQKHLDSLLTLQPNYASVMPFGFIRSVEHPEIIFDTDRQWFGETVSGTAQYIQELKKNGIEVMVKPQLWIWHGEYTGYLAMKTEEDWRQLEHSYREFITTFARVAEAQKVPLFCVGTELESFVKARPKFWKDLIAEIRKIYSGKLTYAANWDEYKHTSIWETLDFIGIDAYFPISEEQTPTLENSLMGWKPWLAEMQVISRNFQKPILFTEYGYRSMDYAGKEPWESSHTIEGVNLEAQKTLLLALFEAVWEQEWFKGGFVWKWHMHHEHVGGEDDNMFTPQQKPAQQVLRRKYNEL